MKRKAQDYLDRVSNDQTRPPTGRVQVGTAMNYVFEDDPASFVDPDTEELNCTRLAEETFLALGGQGDPPEVYFELAHEKHERRTGRAFSRAVGAIISSLDSSWF